MAANQNPNRKSESIRRANRIIQTRSFVLMILMGVVMFVLLFFRLFDLQITRHEELQSKAVNQQTRRTVVTASRGTIYDTAGNILAISSSAETIILSPLEIDNAVNDTEDPVSWTKESLAAGLAEILGKDASAIRKRMDNVKSQYEVIQLRADEDTAAKVRSYVDENKIAGVHLVADTKRYYPYGSLAAQVIGFVGDDNTGLYGLEAYYEEELEGQSGLVISAKDQAENDMLYTYEQYFAAKNGSDLTLTLDTTIQYYLEKGLEAMTDKFSAANGASGIVMNAKTGGIMAMASYPNYDLNDFLTVSDQTLQERIGRGENTLAEMQLLQWRNKALSDTYEPGSTFKIITLSMALEEGSVSESDSFFCGGNVSVLGRTSPIRCWKSGGHGSQTLTQAVQHSCNVAFVNIGQRVGAETFYKYCEGFGFLNLNSDPDANLTAKTGIDLAGESGSIWWSQNTFCSPKNLSQLAAASFGQTFTITPLQLITAVSACVNGGRLMKPYVVRRMLNSDGSLAYEREPTLVRQVISEETSAKVRSILERVVGDDKDGTGRNAAVPGYRIGGKTGTSEKVSLEAQTGEKEYIVSFIGFAPAEDPQIAVLVFLDTPSNKSGIYISGGQMAAPVVGNMMADILPYIGVEAQYSEEERAKMDVAAPQLVGLSKAELTAELQNAGLRYRSIGEGETVTAQLPEAGCSIAAGSEIIVYFDREPSADLETMPDLGGMSYEEARDTLSYYGIYIRTDSLVTDAAGQKVNAQNILPGRKVEHGTVVEVTLVSGDSSLLGRY